MEDEKEGPGPGERLLSLVCRARGARLEFEAREGDGAVAAVLSGSPSPGSAYEVRTLPKASREEACASAARQLLFPRVAKAAGLPPASSADELALKLEVECAP